MESVPNCKMFVHYHSVRSLIWLEGVFVTSESVTSERVVSSGLLLIFHRFVGKYKETLKWVYTTSEVDDEKKPMKEFTMLICNL